MKAHEYDEPGYVPGEAVGVNWLLCQLLEENGLQITKIDNDQLNKFITVIIEGKLVMPSGQPGIVWLKEKIKEKHQMSEGYRSEEWDKTRLRYEFILHRLDLTMAGLPEEELEEKEEYEPGPRFEVSFGDDEQVD